jgi:ActR/RegA family two-component response regulator
MDKSGRMLAGMGLNALLMCRDQQFARLLAGALDTLDIEHETCASASEGMEMLAQGWFGALVLDFDLANAALLVTMARSAPAQRRPVVFAMIGVLTEIAATFQAGANFVLYKPLVFEQVVRALRAGKAFMRADRRHSPRQKLETLVYLQFGIAAMPAVVLDLNEQGISLQSPEPLPPVREIPLRLVLPGTSQMIEGAGEVIWTDDHGRAGMLFSRLTPTSRRQLKQWLVKPTLKTRMLVPVARSAKSRRLPLAAR